MSSPGLRLWLLAHSITFNCVTSLLSFFFLGAVNLSLIVYAPFFIYLLFPFHHLISRVVIPLSIIHLHFQSPLPVWVLKTSPFMPWCFFSRCSPGSLAICFLIIEAYGSRRKNPQGRKHIIQVGKVPLGTLALWGSYLNSDRHSESMIYRVFFQVLSIFFFFFLSNFYYSTLIY